MSEAGTEIRPEHRWPVVGFTAVIMIIWSLLPSKLQFLPVWVIPAVVAGVAATLIAVNPTRMKRETPWSRWLSIGLSLGLAVANQFYIGLLIFELINDQADGPSVLLAALAVWLTNVIAFAIVYWELDDGGPVARRMRPVRDRDQDWLFPQETLPILQPWKPAFFDYFYFSISTMMAFSPTDAMPLSTRAKAFMAYEALIGFVLLALIISRAVNILTPGA
jgi:hypothetical protein